MRKSELRRIIREEILKVHEEYYPSRKENPMYVDGDAIELNRVFIHTNRTNQRNGWNGMIGIYPASGCRRIDKVYAHTNEVFLKGNICFEVSDKGAAKVARTGHRTLVTGIIGDVGKVSNANKSGQVINWSPMNPYFHLKSDPNKEVVAANSVYAYATENGKWIFKAQGVEVVDHDGRYADNVINTKFQK